MPGLSMGRKYNLNPSNKKDSSKKEGVSFSEKSNKWIVSIKNKSNSKYARPFIRVAQFSDKADADDFYKVLIDRDKQCSCKVPEPRMKNSENGISTYCDKCSKNYTNSKV